MPFMPGFRHAGAVAAAPVAVAHLASPAVLNTGGSTRTFSSISFGTEAADRFIYVLVCRNEAGSSSGLTVGGVSATRIAGAESGGGEVNVNVHRALVPTGSSGSVVITYGFDPGSVTIDVFSATGAAEAAFDTLEVNNDGSSPVAGAIDIAANGALIGGVAARLSSAGTWTWTGATEASGSDFLISSGRYKSAASINLASAETGRSISVASSQSFHEDGGCLAAVSLQPAG